MRLFQGVAYACFDTAVFALIVKVTPLAYRGRALGYFMLAPGLATVIAPSFGMFLVNQFSFTVLFLFCMGVSLCSLLFSRHVERAGGLRPDMDTHVPDTFFLERKIIVPAMSAFFHNFVLGIYYGLFPLYAIQCGITNPGYFFSASAVMVIAGRALGGKDPGHLEQRKDHSDIHSHINDRNGHTLLFKDSSHVYFCRIAMGDWSCFHLSCIHGICP